MSALEGKVAVVTGASRGIAAAIARRMAGEGAAVAVSARTERPEDHPFPGLCSGDPRVLTRRTAYSQELLDDLGISPVTA